ncbi:MAG: cytochrome c biogenesis protein ResB [Candidatus Adiutrix sp.]|jgi:hypothetical protein|nr:cytochrome c biogenesis protein ResB [Candidatus Adiutrix sp.]
METNKKMWQGPWRYRESLALTAALIGGGYALQLILGPLNTFLLHNPVNICLAALIILWAALSLGLKKYRLVQWLSGVHLAVSLILALLVFSLFMGLTPQFTRPHPGGGLISRLGFTTMTSSWPFMLIYLATLVSLAMVTFRRLTSIRKNPVFFLNHAGLWLVLAAAGLGASDRARHIMYVEEGDVQWRVFSRDNQVLELPLAIRLDKFDMEEYPPKLAIIDSETGVPLPPGRPKLYQIDPDDPKSRLMDWDLTLLEYIYRAVPAGEGQYKEAPMPASTQAVNVSMKNRKTGEERQGWVTSGNRLLPPAPLVLDEGTVLVMSQPEPRRFASNIKVFTQDGREAEAVLEVNKPLRVGDWLIYQHGYDNQAGRMSSYSSFELVYDPWLYAAYAGLALWALGALGLICQGRGVKSR